MSADFTFTTSSGGPSGQRSISINFVGDAGASMGATESAGVVAKANWNNATGATRSTPLALQDDTGAATGDDGDLVVRQPVEYADRRRGGQLVG